MTVGWPEKLPHMFNTAFTEKLWIVCNYRRETE
uniref:Uncharacterized protein n=1 Tax=Anguilla anguilla TaxID=7936 RepID=A0A0E9XPI7_ANGAN